MKWIAMMLIMLALVGCKRVEPATAAGRVQQAFETCLSQAEGNSGNQIPSESVKECRLLAESMLKAECPSGLLGEAPLSHPRPEE